MRRDILEHSSSNNKYATEEYAQFKRNHSNTHARCLEKDIKFVPMIIEASGGTWGLDAEDVWKIVIKSAAALTGEPISAIANEFYQSMSITLHRSNARSILKRLPGNKKVDWVVEAAINILAEVEQ